MTKKVVLKVHVHDSKEKQKAMKAVSSLSGLESLAMDMKEKKLTVVGDIDPVEVVSKLRKFWNTEILTVGPAKEPEKKKEDDQPKKDDDSTNKKKLEDEMMMKKKKIESEQFAELIKMYRNYNNTPYYTQQHYHVYSAEDDPNSCVIS